MVFAAVQKGSLTFMKMLFAEYYNKTFLSGDSDMIN